jgi:hypothetical protein
MRWLPYIMQPLLCAVADPIHCSEPHTPRAKIVTDRTLPKFGVRVRRGLSVRARTELHEYLLVVGPSKCAVPSSKSDGAPQDCSRYCEKLVRDRWNTQLQGNPPPVSPFVCPSETRGAHCKRQSRSFLTTRSMRWPSKCHGSVGYRTVGRFTAVHACAPSNNGCSRRAA